MLIIHSKVTAGKLGVAFIAVNLKTKYLVTNKDKSKKMFHVPVNSKKKKPPRHAFLCYYQPGKKSSTLFVFDPMTKKQAVLENHQGMWSISILNKLYHALNKPTVVFRYGASRGSDCLWQSLRMLDQITHEPSCFDQFTCQ